MKKMGKREELAGVRVDICDLREALHKIELYMGNECLNIVETINMKTIIAAGEDEKVRRCLEEMDLVIPSDKEILVELGVGSGQYPGDVEENQLLYESLKRACRGKRGIYLLTGTRGQMDTLCNYLEENFDDCIMICGSCIFEECTNNAESVVNEINSVAPHMILAMLPTPMQEHFIYDHRKMLNAKIWFGIGTENDPLTRRNNPGQICRRFLARHKMKRRIQSYETEDAEE